MEFRNNVIFSVIVHVSVAIMILVFAGRNAALSRLPADYIAVSLLEYMNEKGPVPPANKLTAGKESDSRTKLPQSRKVPQLNRAESRTVPSGNEKKTIPYRYSEDNSPHENKVLREGMNPDGSGREPPITAQEQPSQLQSEAETSGEASGDYLQSALLTESHEIISGNSLELNMIGSHTAGGRAGLPSRIDLIRASIERAKKYPAFAKERGQKGVVVVEFSINAKGRPENIRVMKSSGFSLLDAEATNTIVRAAPFPVVKGSIDVPIVFVLDNGR
jgi:TonB family protein